MNEIFEEFSIFLSERLAAKIPMTEDTVRYTFFHSVMNSGDYDLNDIVLELEHPTIKRARIDTFISGDANRGSAALEFKYDRSIPSGKNQPRTMKAGAVFNDLFRLVNIPSEFAALKVFVYLTDSEMATYFRNPNNAFDELFELPQGDAIRVETKFFAELPKSFQAKITSPIRDFMLVSAFSRELIGNHSIRIYYVFPSDLEQD